MVWQFNEPEDIRKFGRMIDDFSRAGKALAKALLELNYTRVDAESIVGEGHYNTLDDAKADFIHYAKHTAMPLRGLFGAFVMAHIPEMALVRRMPTLLGKRGFEFVAIRNDVEVASRPLNGDDFDFISYAGAAQGQGALTLREDWRLPDGKLVALANTEISKPLHPRSFVGGTLRFMMLDGSGKKIADNFATQILWGSLGAKGMKVYGQFDPRRAALAQSGTDDDFTAEAALINCLNELRTKHQTDLMPDFNQLVARQAVVLREEKACSLAVYHAASTMITAGKKAGDLMTAPYFHAAVPDDDQAVLQAFNRERIETSMEALADCFGLTLPSTLDKAPDVKAIADRFTQEVGNLAQGARTKIYTYQRTRIGSDIVRAHIEYPTTLLSPNFAARPLGQASCTLHVHPKKSLSYDANDFVSNLPREDRQQVMSEVVAMLPDQLQSAMAGELKQLARTFGELCTLKGYSKDLSKMQWVEDATHKIAQRYNTTFEASVVSPGLLIAMEALVGKSSKIVQVFYRRNTGKDVSVSRARRAVEALKAVDGDLRQVTARFSVVPDLTALPFFADLQPLHAVQRPISSFQIPRQNTQPSPANL